MKITVAGTEKEYESGVTVAQLIAYEHVDTPEYVTVSINDEFVEKENFGTTALHSGDSVEFLYFMGGGR